MMDKTRGGNAVVGNSVLWGISVGNCWGSVVDWSVVGNSNWGSNSVVSDGNGLVGDNLLGNDSWGLTVNDGVESVDWISGVGDGTDSTIGLNKGVLSLDDISVAGFVGRLLVSGEGIRDGVSVVVLWMRVVWLSADGGNSGLSEGNWSGNGVMGNSNWSVVGDSQWSMVGDSQWSMVGNSVLWGISVSYWGSSIAMSNESSGVGQRSSWAGSGISHGGKGEKADKLVHVDGYSKPQE